MKDFWNERYSEQEFVYGTEPNNFFKEHIENLESRTIILPAEGEGRNAIYAASKGWDVTAVDYSEQGKKKALKLAEQKGVNIKYDLSDLADYDFGQNKYDAAAFIYVHLPRSIIKDVYSHVISSVKPGGKIIVEVYSVNQLGRNSGGPKDKRVLYTEEKLRDLLSGTDIKWMDEVEVTLNEGMHHVGKAMVFRAIAEKV
ncbi:MAG: class I SAM-dependent methyltransferase [Gracilimonas sp.]|uniref:class I SAM-dependent methyltransferase n=1 Tax=Gracilimonas sp. TaxID=1974203 RepID=UPI0019AFC540|nr:class I SAM-dependent methyltransferase [Gracilimonas sp.]MBD3616581.1 class I SAM-dependent methyltransferase [Gracilimonas sp.]